MTFYVRPYSAFLFSGRNRAENVRFRPKISASGTPLDRTRCPFIPCRPFAVNYVGMYVHKYSYQISQRENFKAKYWFCTRTVFDFANLIFYRLSFTGLSTIGWFSLYVSFLRSWSRSTGHRTRCPYIPCRPFAVHLKIKKFYITNLKIFKHYKLKPSFPIP